jgi:hypothetical protein
VLALVKPLEDGDLALLDPHWTHVLSAHLHTSAYVSIRQHTSAHVRIRQHTSAYVSILH